jgi:hypothetical protein
VRLGITSLHRGMAACILRLVQVRRADCSICSAITRPIPQIVSKLLNRCICWPKTRLSSLSVSVVVMSTGSLAGPLARGGRVGTAVGVPERIRFRGPLVPGVRALRRMGFPAQAAWVQGACRQSIAVLTSGLRTAAAMAFVKG